MHLALRSELNSEQECLLINIDLEERKEIQQYIGTTLSTVIKWLVHRKTKCFTFNRIKDVA